VGESRAALWAAVQRLRIATEGVDAYLDTPAVALPRTAALPSSTGSFP